MESRMRGNVQVRFGAERPGNSSTTPGLSLHFPPGRGFYTWPQCLKNHLRTELVLEALQNAISQRRPQGVIHHSDRGCQYTSYAFGKRCQEAGVMPSMGSVGDCYD